MGKVRFIIPVMIVNIFACFQSGCNQTDVAKEAVPFREEKPAAARLSIVVQQSGDVVKVPSVSKEHKENTLCCLSKEAELASYSKDDRPVQEIISRLTGAKIGPDNSGDVYSAGLTAIYTGPRKIVPGEGKYGKLFSFLPVIRWYDPDHYYTPGVAVPGTFKPEECIMCHTVQTPGIVAQWKRSKHATAKNGVVGCDACHGNNHLQLHMPSWRHCGECHPEQRRGHRDGMLGSHAHAFHVNVVEVPMQVAKPAEEVTACAACHGIAENRCDGCHTRHDFSVAEARKPNNCGVCHSGLEHCEYEMYRGSYHGAVYESEQYSWDWSKPLKPENYKAPTCAYCHMKDGEHNVQKASTIYSHAGRSLVDRGAPRFKEARQNWINICKGCHSPRFAADQLEAMDEAVKVSFTKWREAMKIVMDLYNEGLLDPMPGDLAPDWTGHYTFSLLPEGESRMYNVSDIERISCEMLFSITNKVYKAMAHGAMQGAAGNGPFLQDRWLVQVKSEASKLRRIKALEDRLGVKHSAYDFWKYGEYTDLLAGWKRKSDDVDATACKHVGTGCLGE
ncbi:MAG: multiheme c-type cytochrome [Candidatus Loosdrechtia sp.]|uniref:multiheme c-type cytochrome n=1 Tax=Candidatus Loosdrechtia sp. TaxID=3101272 RepID=UPI003A62AA96|nr:MAG: multiheme c-type cytochrome [Candidatus Jettenia sp. AMX2]